MANIFYAQRGLSPCGNDCGPAPFKNAAAFPRAGPGIFGRAVCGHFSPVARMCGGGGTGMKNRNPSAELCGNWAIYRRRAVSGRNSRNWPIFGQRAHAGPFEAFPGPS